MNALNMLSEVPEPRPVAKAHAGSPAKSDRRPRVVEPWQRDYRLDFFRGAALFLIFIDHIQGNVLGYFTLRSISFSDAAEVFIFISGFAAALVYGRVLKNRGIMFAVARIYRRAWSLYVAHLVLFMLYIAEVSYSVRSFNNAMYNDELHVGDFLNRPDIAIIEALLLQFQPTFLDILPLYITLLLAFPFILMAIARNRWLVLLPSFLLYLGVQIWGWNLTGYPARDWFFDPLAWQFVFILGGVCGYTVLERRRVLPGGWWLTAIAGIIVTAAALIQVSWVLHTVWSAFPPLQPEPWPSDKTTLQPLRLINFVALAILVSRLIPPNSRFLASRFSLPIILCGQHSLNIFCLSILLALSGHFLFQEVSGSLPMQAFVNLAGFAVMIASGFLLAWYDNDGRIPRVILKDPGVHPDEERP